MNQWSGTKRLAFAISLGVFLLPFFAVQASAQQGPSQLNISGGLYNPNGTPVTQNSVNFRLEVWDKNGTCVLYSEVHSSQDLSNTKGGFALEIGKGTSIANNIDAGTPGALSSKVFENPGAVAPFAGCASGITLASGDNRSIRVYYDLGGGYTAMTPDVPIASSAYAMVADTLQGKRPTDFIQTRDDVSTDLNQTNIETIFSAVNFAKLVQILSGNFGGSVVTNVGTPTAGTDATNKNYVDANIGGRIADTTAVGPAAGNGHTLIWDQSLNRWVTGVPSATDNTKLPLAGGTMTGGLSMGSQTLHLGNLDTTAENALVLTFAGAPATHKGKIWFNTSTNLTMVWNGASAVAINSGATGAAGGDLTGTYPNPDIASGVVGSAELTDLGVATGDIANNAITSAKINNAGVAVNRLLITDATTGATVGYKTCNLNEALMWTATGWDCTTVANLLGTSGVTAATYGSATQVSQVSVDGQGRVTGAANVAIAFPVISVAGKTGAVSLNYVDIGGLGSAAVKDFGVAAGNLVELDGSGKIPVGLLPSTSGDIQDVIASNGLLGGGSSGAVTLSVDTGITTGKIVQMAASDKLPAVDGSNLTQINAVKLQTRDVAATAPTAGQYLVWNAASSAWEPQTLPAGNIGDMTSVTASTGLLGGSSSGDATLSVDVGVTAGKIVQMQASDKLPAVDGSDLTQINAVRLQTRAVASTAPAANQILKWNGTLAQWEPSSDVDTGITQLTGDVTAGPGSGSQVATIGNDRITAAKINSAGIAVNRLLITDATTGANVTYATCSLNEILKWTASGWVCAPDAGGSGFVTHIGTGNGLLGGPITTTGTISIDTGVTTGKIIQVAASDRLPVIDGSNLTQINAVRLQTRAVAATAPTAGQYLVWNAGSSTWEPQTLPAGNVGDVTSVTASTGLLGGAASGDATLSVDVGVTAGKVVQMQASDKLPAVDGSDLTQINAVRLQTRAVSATVPTSQQVLSWNSGTSAWEPRTDLGGSVVSVVSGTGLIAGNITNTGTLNVDVGTVSGKIVQMAASNKLPAVDGSDLTQVNAVRLQTRAVSAAAPTDSQVLTWNNGSSTWEARSLPAGNVGDITSVNPGTGLVGGSASGDATLNVDVGTVTGKIVQMAASNKLPAVDGSNLTGITASQISGSFAQNGNSFGGAATLGTNDNFALNFETNNSTAMTIASDGDVGIGTGSPATKLDVNGDFRAKTDIQIQDPINLMAAGLATQLTFRDSGGNSVGSIGYIGQRDLRIENLDAAYGINLATGGASTMYLAPNNRVGIGYPGAPIEKVDIYGGRVRINNGANLILDPNATFANIYTNAPGIGLGTGFSSTHIYAASSGNVGIGTTSPQSKLHVDGIVRATEICDENGANCKDISSGWGAGGDIDGVYSSTGLLGGFASGSGTLSVDVGTTTGKIVQVAASNKLPAIDGSNLTGITSSQVSGAFAQNGNSFGAAAVLGTNDNFAMQFEANGATAMTILPAGDIGIGTASPGSKLHVVNGSNETRVNGHSIYVYSMWPTVSIGQNTIPNAAGADLGKVTFGSTAASGTMATNASIQARSTQSHTGSTKGTQLVFATTRNTDSSGTEVMVLDHDGRLRIGPGNPNSMLDVAGVIRATDICDENGANCKDISGGWGGGGDIDGVYSSTGLLGGFASGSGTLSVDVGTTTGKIVQVAASNKLPAMDGSNLTAINAVQLQARNVSAAAPTSAQVLGWNASNSSWEPKNESDAFVGTVTSVVGGTGLLGGNITTAGTLAIDVGTTTGKIVQVAASNKLPAMDGSNLTAVNAAQLQARNVASTAPTASQVLGWNAGNSTWEPQTVSVATGGGFINNGNSFGGAATIGTNDNFALNFEANNATAMTILPSGFVGVNTGSPGYPLDVNGVANFQGNLQVNNNAIAGADSLAISDPGADEGVRFSTTAANWVLDVSPLARTNADGNFNIYGTANNIALWRPTLHVYNATNYTTMTPQSSGGLDITSTGTGHVTFNPGGNVGIGTLSPSGKLHTFQTASNANIFESRSDINMPQLDFVRNRDNAGANEAVQTGDVLGHMNFRGYNGTATATGAVISGLAGENWAGGARGGVLTFSTTQISTSTLNERMRIDQFGNTGIGTNNPQSLLHVNGVIRATDICDENGANCRDISGGWGAGGDIDGVYTSTGLVGGFASGSGTLSVDVGTTTGKIVQVAASNKLPAMDGSNLTSVSAAQLQARNVASTAPTAAQVLGWNAGNSTWEPQTVSVSTGGGFINGGNSFGGAATVGTNDNFGLNLETNGTTAITINNAGAVGVGTSTSNVRMAIKGGLRVDNENDSTGGMSWQNGLSFGATSGEAISSKRDAGGNQYGLDLYTGGLPHLSITSGGNVGVGTTTPGSKFEVVSSPTTTASYNSVHYDSTWSPSGASANEHRGLNTITRTGGGSTITNAGLIGGYNQANHSVTGTVGYVYGGMNHAYNGTTGTITDARGTSSVVTNVTSGAIGFAYGVRSLVQNQGAGTIGSGYGMHISINNWGTFTNGYGLYINDIQATNDYGVYQNGADDVNYFAGNTGIGTNNPQSLLHVNGIIRATDICDENGANCKDISTGWAGNGFVNGGNSFGAAATLGTNDNNVLNFETNGATAMTILANGNVGVGTGAANAALHVNRSVNGLADTMILSNPAAYAWGRGSKMKFEGVGDREMANMQSFWDGSTSNSYLTFAVRKNDTMVNVIHSDADGPDNHPKVSIGSPPAVGGQPSAGLSHRLGVMSETGAGNTVANSFTLQSFDSNSGASSGIGNKISFVSESSTDAVFAETSTIISVMDDATNASKDGSLRFATLGPNAAAGANDATEKMRIASSGNVGIGTTNPLSLLHVNGVVRATDICDENGANCKDISAGWAGGGFAEGGNSFGAAATLGTNDNFALNLEANNTTVLTVNTNSRVGINTTSPGRALHVYEGTGINPNMRLQHDAPDALSRNMLEIYRSRSDATAPTSGFGSNIVFQGEGFTNGSRTDMSGIGSFWETNQTDDTTARDGMLTFMTALNGSMGERVRITSAGNVGIGTTNPGSALHVLDATTAPQLTVGPSTGANAQAVLSLRSKDGGVPNEALITANNTGELQFKPQPGQASVFYSGGTPVMTVLSTGNVGIGTTNPYVPFQMNGAVEGASWPFNSYYYDNVTAMAAGVGGGIGFGGRYDGTSSVVVFAGVRGGKENATTSNTDGYLSLHTRSGANQNERMRISSGGNVGIGTTAPNAMLDVAGSNALSGDISPAQITANTNNYNPAGLAGASILRLSTDASRQLTGLQGGVDGRAIEVVNVGAQNLVLVNESASSTAAYRFAIGANLTIAGGQGVRLIYDSTSSRWRATGSSASSGGSSQWVTTGSDIYYTTGRVGIGTTGPITNGLTIQTPADNGGILLLGGADPAAGVAAPYMGAPVASGYSNSPAYSWWYQSDTGIANPANSTMSVKAGGAEVMRWTPTGYVGINNNAPNVALDVTGDIEYTGTITDVSDRRLKENIQPVESGIEVIRNLPVYSYTMKNDPKHKLEYGVMAQDLLNLVPDLVRVIDDEKGYMGVNYIGLIPWSIRAIQEIDRDVASLKQENQAMKSRLDKLEEQNKELSEQVRHLIEMHKREKQRQ